MSGETTQDLKEIAQVVKTSLQKAEEAVSGLRKTNTRLFAAGIGSSAASTLIAGITAARGPMIGEGTEGWRIACIIVAIAGFASTLIAGLSQQLRISERLSEGTQIVGKLRYLDMIAATGKRSWEEIVREYEEIIKAFPAIIR